MPKPLFLLDKALNRLETGVIEIYLDHFLELAEFNDVDSLVSAVAKTMAHEIGHDVGLLHTSNSATGADITAVKFHDRNANGVRDDGDEGEAAVSIELLQEGRQIDMATTEALGRFQFDGLDLGRYQVRLTLSTEGGFEASTEVEHTVESLDNAVAPMVVEFGNFKRGSIEVRQYHDRNANKTRDKGEEGLGGTPVTLSGTTGRGVPVSRNGPTDATGVHSFDDLEPGHYTITEQPQPPFENSTPLSVQVELASGENPVVEFGNFMRGSITGTKLTDTDGDGIGDEPAIATITAEGPGAEGKRVTMTTQSDDNGHYAFSQRLPGTHIVSEVPSENALISPREFHEVMLESGETASNVNFVNACGPGGVPCIGSPRDFGDAPDSYRVTISQNGPWHYIDIDDNLGLGPDIDDDFNGQPDMTAEGDDRIDVPFGDFDDEDGVDYLSALIPGTTAKVKVIIRGDGFLAAWLDFDRNGSFSQLSERIHHAAVSSTVEHEVTVPVFAKPGDTFARFRLYESRPTLDASPRGYGGVGEVEDHAVTIEPFSLDFGDLPNVHVNPDDPTKLIPISTYPTSEEDDGARHLIDPEIHLGFGVDPEPNGQGTRDSTAQGDDNDGNDDDDGVTFNGSIMPGTQQTITIKVSADGVRRGAVLQGFVDFNADGSFQDDEHIIVDKLFNAQEEEVTFEVPLTTDIEGIKRPGVSGIVTYARFRYSTLHSHEASGAAAAGAAPDGEVEGYFIEIQPPPLDYADAPDDPARDDESYPTRLENDGARHVVVPDLCFGDRVDLDVDGVPSEAADGDDVDVDDDEDGVILPSAVIPFQTVPVVVTASQEGKLDAFFDFNGDGDWDEPDEKIFDSVDLAEGPNNLTFLVPLAARQGTLSFARFRYSRDGGLGPAGIAADGEVEDYQVAIGFAPFPLSASDSVNTGSSKRLDHPDADLDIMAQGLDLEHRLSFKKTDPALRIALGTVDYAAYGPGFDVVLAAKKYYLDHHRVTGSFGGFDATSQGTGGQPGLTLVEGALFVIDQAAQLLTESLDLGQVSVDGTGGEQAIRTLELINYGGADLTIASLGFEEGDGAAFSVAPQIAPSTVIGPGQNLEITVTFDPTSSGDHVSALVIEHDGLGTDRVEHAGFGLSPDGDIRVAIDNNNVGGVRVDAGRAVFEDFLSISNIGAANLTISDIAIPDSGDGQFQVEGLPDGFPGAPLVLAPGESFDLDVAFDPAVIGLVPGAIAIISDDPQTPSVTEPVVGTGLAPVASSAFVRGRDYVLIETPESVVAPRLRTITDDAGSFSFFLPPSAFAIYSLFDPESGLIGHVNFTSQSSGQVTQLPAVSPGASFEADFDGDGLPADIERVVGTSDELIDTDGDDISDFDELELGSDPLGGFGLPIGVVGSAMLDGEAMDLVVEPAKDDPAWQLAYVATGSHGLAIVDVTDPTLPIVQSQIDLSGENNDISFDPFQQLVAIAAGTGGLHIVSIEDAMRPAPLGTVGTGALGGNARDGAIFEDVALVAVGSDLVSIDLVSREVVNRLDVGSSTITDTFRLGSTLFTIAGGTLKAVDLSGDNPQLHAGNSSLLVTGARGELFVADGTAYMAAFAAGYTTADVSDPQDLGPFTNTGVNAAVANTAMVANRAGLGLVAGDVASPFGTDFAVDLFDVSDPTAITNDQFLTRFFLIQSPNEIILAGGRAFVATDGALEIVNFLEFDDQQVPPAIQISSTTQDEDDVAPGVQITEGVILPINVVVTDDVQVGALDLLFNGELVQRDISFPYDLAAAATAGTGVSDLTVQVRASDIGSNSSLSNVLPFELIRDETPPQLIAIDPADRGFRALGTGGAEGDVTVTAEFSEALLAATVSPSTFELRDETGTTIAAESIELQTADRRVVLQYTGLSEQQYSLIINGAAITDPSGNRLSDGDLVSTFRLVEGTIFFSNIGGGEWGDPNNWTVVGERIPNETDVAVIGVPGAVTITMDDASDDFTVGTLFTEELISNHGSDLIIMAESVLSGGLDFHEHPGGTVASTARVSIGGSSDWSAGFLTGAGGFTNTGRIVFGIPGSATIANIQETTFTNEGTFEHLDRGTLRLRNATFHNAGTHEFKDGNNTIDTDGLVQDINPFNNTGVLIKSGGDDASVIDVPVNSTDVTVTVQTGTIVLERGSTNTNTDFVIFDGAKLELRGGTVHDHSFDGTTNVTGAGTFAMTSGDVLIGAGGLMNFEVATFEMAAPGTFGGEGSAVSSGHLVWTGSANVAMAGGLTNTATGTIDLDPPSTNANLQTILNNEGRLNYVGSKALRLSGGTLNNSGTLDIQSNGDILSIGQEANVVNNTGKLVKSGGTGTSTIGAVFNSTGVTVAAHTGTLELKGGGTNTDTDHTVGAEAVLQLNGGTHTIDGSTSITGEGIFEVKGGTFEVGDEGTVTFNLTGPVGLRLAGSTATLAGPGAAVNLGKLTWANTTVIATQGGFTNRASGLIEITGAGRPRLETVLDNEGTFNHLGNNNFNMNNGTVNNAGIFDLQGNGNIGRTGGSNAFNNTGEFMKSGGTGTSVINVPFNHTPVPSMSSAGHCAWPEEARTPKPTKTFPIPRRCTLTAATIRSPAHRMWLEKAASCSAATTCWWTQVAY